MPSRIQGLDVVPSARPRSPLVHTASSHRPHQLELQSSKSPPLPPRSPLRPHVSSRPASKDAQVHDMPPPMLRMSSLSTFSIETLIDSLPPSNIIIDGAFLGDKSKHPSLLTVPRTPSPDKPLPTTPSSASSSSPTSTGGSTLDSPRLRDPLDSPPSSGTITSKAVTNGTSKRTHALIELIESERAYASDLALIRDIHLPVALGNEPSIPTPPQSSSSSLRTLCDPSGSSTTLLGPPMTRDDARTIFSNLPELAEFADDFVSRLETALGNVLPGGKGEDSVGALFIEMVPHMKLPYMHYITHHPTSLTHLNSLPQTSALAAYLATTRTLAQKLSHAWDLPSLLIKPVQRLLKYALLLNAIIEATPGSHGDKENLRRAKSMLEDISHAINESQRGREIVKEVFAAGKPAELLKKKGLGIVGRVRGGVTTPRSISRADSEETEQVVQMERSINSTTDFIQRFAKETVDWVKTVQVLMSALRIWAEGFGRVIGLGPDVTSEAFDAFLVVVDKQLTALCIDLKTLVEEQLLQQLRVLLDTVRRPNLLLETLHALEPHRHALLQHNPAKGRPPPALNDASVAFVALRAQLITELPAYISLLDAGVMLCVGQVIKWQAGLWRDVRTRWSDLWEALRVEGEMNAGNEETERVWRGRWEEAKRDLYKLKIIDPDNLHPDKLTPRSRQARTSPPSPTTTRTGTASANTGSLDPARLPQIDAPSYVDSTSSPHRKRSFNTSSNVHRLARRPSTESFHSIRSARSSSGHGHHVEAPEYTSSPPRRAMSRRQSMPMSLHHSQSHGQLPDSYGRESRERDRGREEGARGGAGGKHSSPLPSLQRRNAARPGDPYRQSSPHPPQRQYTHPHPHPPMPPMPQLIVSSRWYRAPTLYTCRVVHQCEPPEGVEYYGLPFFNLFLDDVYHVVKEAGHPSRHSGLPLLVDEGEDCLLLARDSNGDLGWLLASFLFPVD